MTTYTHGLIRFALNGKFGLSMISSVLKNWECLMKILLLAEVTRQSKKWRKLQKNAALKLYIAIH